jgi:Uma2 family endonuclease
MGSTARKSAHFGDLMDALAFDERLELYHGQIHKKAAPSGEHSDAQSGLISILRNRYGRSGGGNPGGWWIKSEASVFYPKHEALFHHDLAGWRRSRVPENPKGFPARVAPDWVCEICISTHKKDEVILPQTLIAHGIPWYWLMDVERGILTTHQLAPELGKYAVHQKVFRADGGEVNLAPFEDYALPVELIFGGDG